jgi:glucose-6-phosphate 1-epimerase
VADVNTHPFHELIAPDGARATIALDGAHVTSWIPAGESENRLFVSARSTYGLGNAIRGGIPIVFPQFGAFGSLAQHGFARRRRWMVLDATTPGRATFGLHDDDETRVLWPHAFEATVQVDVGGPSLAVTLTVHNTGESDFTFTAAFHPYFAVRRAFGVVVEGLTGCRYRDSLRDGGVFDERDAHLQITGPLDRIYYRAPDRLTLRDGDRVLTIDKTGFPEAVVWNPGVEGTRSRADFLEGDEHAMLCVEAALIEHPLLLTPDASWTGVQRMTAG